MTNSEIKYQYQRAVNKKIEDEMKMNKSTFRVMPAEYSPPKQKFEDSLHHEINHYENAKKSIVESRNQSVHKKQSLSKSVFGYDISPETFRK